MKPDELASAHCTPRKGEEHALAAAEVERYLAHLPGWILSADGKGIDKTYRFDDFHRTMAFVNAVAWIAHAEDHHPDLELGYAHCTVRYRTHAVGGVSINDLICAAKVDALLP